MIETLRVLVLFLLTIATFYVLSCLESANRAKERKDLIHTQEIADINYDNANKWLKLYLEDGR